MSVARTIAKNSFFNIIASASDLVIVLVIGIVLARSLGPEQYGLYAYLMWFLGLTEMVVSLGLKETSKRFIAEAGGHQRIRETHGFARMALIIRGGASLFVCFVITISSGYWAQLTGDPGNQIYFILIAFTLVPYAVNSTFSGIFEGFQKYEYSAYVMLGTGPLRLVLIVVLMALGFGIREVLSINMAVWVVGIVIGLLLMQRLIPLKGLLPPLLLDTAAKKRALKYALTMTGVLGVNYLMFRQAEVSLIGIYCPVKEVGFYRMAFQIASMAMMLVPRSFAWVLTPAIAEQFGKGDMVKIREIYLTSIRYVMLMALPLAVGLIALARPIITLFYGPDYAPAITLLQILVLPLAFVTIGTAATAVLRGINHPGFILKTGGLLGLLNIGLGLWMIPIYGVLGAAIASSVPRVLSFPFYTTFASKRVSATWPVRDTVKIVLASLAMGAVVFGLQGYLGDVLSLSVGVPVGILIYVAALLALGAVYKQDLTILKVIQSSLPTPLRKNYGTLLTVVQKVVR